MALEDFPDRRCASIIDAGSDEGAAASHAFGVEVGLAFGYPCPSERADKTASRTAHDRPCHRTGGGSHQPPRCHDGSDTWNCQEAEARQETARTAHYCADTCALPRVLGGVRGAIRAVSIVDVIRNDADVGVGDAVRFKSVYRGYRGIIRVIKGSDCWVITNSSINYKA